MASFFAGFFSAKASEKSYQVKPNATLTSEQKYYHLYVSHTAADAPGPAACGSIANACFAENSNAIFATCADNVCQRKVRVKGANNFDAPTKPMSRACKTC